MKNKPELKDKFYVSYGVFYMMGMLSQVPFHFFTNALGYWMYKFNGPPPGSDPRPGPGPGPGPDDGPEHPEFTGCPPGSFKYIISSPHEFVSQSTSASIDKYLCQEINPPNDRTPLQTNFTSSFVIVTQSSMLISFLIVTLFSNRFPAPEKRIVAALSILCMLFGFNTILTQVDTSREIWIFFAATIITTIMMNFCSVTALLSTFQLVTKFPVSYYPSLHSGQSICGIIASLFQIILISTRMPPQCNGTYYFGFGTLIILLATVFHIIIGKKSKYFIYRVNATEMRLDQPPRMIDVFDVVRQRLTSAFGRIKWYYASLIFVLGSTVMIFPGFTALVVSVNSESENRTEWEDLYFSPVVSFLLYHGFNFIGRETAKIVKTPKHGMVIMILAVLRVALVPMMIFCNAHPRNHLPVYFGDTWYTVLISIFAFTEGILLNVIILAIPSVVKQDEVEVAMILVPVISFITVTLCSGFGMLITNLI